MSKKNAIKPSARYKRLAPRIAKEWKQQLASDRARKKAILAIPVRKRTFADKTELSLIRGREDAYVLGMIEIPESPKKK